MMRPAPAKYPSEDYIQDASNIPDDEEDGEDYESIPNLPNFREFDSDDAEPLDMLPPQSGSMEEYSQSSAHASRTFIPVPEVVKQFVTYLRHHIQDKHVFDILSMYENSFNKITEKYFKQSPWPSAESIANLVDNDPIFLMLYKELYFRHIYAKMVPTLEQRFDSWKNYCDLFNFLLEPNPKMSLDLPAQWLWDMIDEFIYQFQAFCQYQTKLKNKPPDELTVLKNNPQVWNVSTVIGYLQSLISKSQTQSNNPLYSALGHFSIIGLLRLHTLLGDYYLALKTIAPIEIGVHKGLHTTVLACYTSVYYYLGFVYMMTRRYVDAIRIFSHILLYINRTKQVTRTYQHDQVLKKCEQMYGLLAICLSLCPQRVDETVHATLREKYTDKMQKMQKGDEMCFEELFSYACPKFINPAPPNFALTLEDPIKYPPMNYNQEAMALQSKLFMNEVKQSMLVPTIRSFLKLYTTIPVSKLAAFLEMDEKSFRKHLMCFKHKTRGVVWTGGPPLNGELAAYSDVDFYLDKDMVHINDTKIQRRYSEFFIRHINKFHEIMAEVKTPART